MATPTRSIEQQIRVGKEITLKDATFRNQCVIELPSSLLRVNTNTVLSKYRNLLWKQVKFYQLGKEDIVQFNYRPTFLSYRLYGTIELAPMILQINNMKSASEFTNLDDGIFLFGAGIRDVLFQILNKEEVNLNENRDKVNQEILDKTKK